LSSVSLPGFTITVNIGLHFMVSKDSLSTVYLGNWFVQAPKKEQNPSGLGRAIINRKAKDARKMQESGLVSAVRNACLLPTEGI
jgi:hypothetical protein